MIHVVNLLLHRPHCLSFVTIWTLQRQSQAFTYCSWVSSLVSSNSFLTSSKGILHTNLVLFSLHSNRLKALVFIYTYSYSIFTSNNHGTESDMTQKNYIFQWNQRDEILMNWIATLLSMAISIWNQSCRKILHMCWPKENDY